MEIQSFIESYANVVSKVDIERIATYFHDYFTLSTQKDIWHIKNDDIFKANLRHSFDGYKALGASKCKLLNSDIVQYPGNHCIVTIQWGLIDDHNNTFIIFDISYGVKKINDELRFIFVIAHNENEKIEEYIQDNN